MKYTIKDLQRDFPDDFACLKWLVEYLYPDGIWCKVCKKVTPHHAMHTRKSYSCEACGHHVHPTAGTIFHKSSTPLPMWFYAIYLISSTRAGISAKQLERELGVTYKTAWRMMHQIRSRMGDDDRVQLTGEVEVDETYLGGRAYNRKHSHETGRASKPVIFGMVQRGGKAKVRHVKSNGARALLPEIQKGVAAYTPVYSDEWRGYTKLPDLGYPHESVKHSQMQFRKGNAYTQNVENLWSVMKPGIRAVYRHVGDKYVQAYANEYSFRYSNRKSPSMFWVLMNRVSKA